MSNLRAAVIGVGAMGRNHARLYHELPAVDLVGVADTSGELANSVARSFGTRPYVDAATMLRDQHPDVVSVAVPTRQHREVVEVALLSGSHVLVEKPIAADMSEAQSMVACAKRSQRVLMVGHVERFNPAVVELRRRVQAGDLGRIFQISARRLGPFPPRIRDVGVVLDLATHDVDVMRFITGSEVARLFAQGKREVHTSGEDLFCGIMRFENDTIGLLEINWLTPTKIRELWVTGERGMFRVDYLIQDLYFYANAATEVDDWDALRSFRGVSEGEMTRFPIAKREPLRAELEAFVEAARTGIAPAAATEGAIALDLALRLIESARANQVQELTRILS